MAHRLFPWLLAVLLAAPGWARPWQVDYPVGAQRGCGPLRVAWDGQGELLVTRTQGTSRDVLSRAQRNGPGTSWLMVGDGWSDVSRARVVVSQVLRGRVVNETPLLAPPTSRALWLGPRSQLPAAEAKRLSRGMAVLDDERSDSLVAFADAARDLPPRAVMLRSVALIVVAEPLDAASDRVLAEYATAGGFVAVRDANRDLARAPRLRAAGPAVRLAGQPPLERRRLGLGVVVTIGASTQASDDLWQRVLIAGQTYQPHAEALSGLRLERALLDRNPPQPAYLGLFLAVYLLAVASAPWLLRRRRGRHAWLLAPLVALVATLGATVWVRVTDPCPTTLAQVTVAAGRSGERWAKATNSFALTSGARRAYSLTVPGDRVNFRNDAPASWDQAGARVYGPWHVPARATRGGLASAPLDLGGTVRLNLRWEGAGLACTIVNETPHRLRGAALLHAEMGVTHIGDIAAGVSRQVRAQYHDASSAALEPARVFAALAATDTPSDEAQSIWRYYAAGRNATNRYDSDQYVDSLAPEVPRVLLVAWVDAPWLPVAIAPTPARERHARLLCITGTTVAPVVKLQMIRTAELQTCLDPGSAVVRYTAPVHGGRASRLVAVAGPGSRLWNHRLARWERLDGTHAPAADYLLDNQATVLVPRAAQLHQSPAAAGPPGGAPPPPPMPDEPKTMLTLVVEYAHGQR